MANKPAYIASIDEDIWRKFTSICKGLNKEVGNYLEEILKKQIEKDKMKL